MLSLPTLPVPAEPACPSRQPANPLAEPGSPGPRGPAIAKNVPRLRHRAYYAAVRLSACLGIAAAIMEPATTHADTEAHRSSSVDHQQRNHELAQSAAPPAAGHPPAQRARPAHHGTADIVRATLPSGMRVIIKRDPAAPAVALRAQWTGGLRQELPEQNGITQLMAALFTRGCGGLDSGAMAAQVQRLGGQLAGLAGRNSFGLRSRWPAMTWASGLELMARCAIAPHWHQAELARAKRHAAGELARRASQPSAVAFRLFARTLYQHHPYGLDPLGTRDTVAALSREALVQRYRDSFPLGDMTLAIVGPVSPDDALDQVRQVFGHRGPIAPASHGSHGQPASHQRTRPRPRRAVPPVRFGGRPARSREVYGYLPGSQAYVMLGFPGTTFAHADRSALEVLAALLGGPTGRLARALEHRQALAHQVGAVSVPGVDTGHVLAYLACAPHALGAAVAALRSELAQVASTTVSASELDQAKRALIATHERSLAQPAAVAAGLAFHEAHGLGSAQYLRYPAAIRAVTAADVQRVAATYLDWEAAVTATVMPPAASPEAQKRSQGVKRRIPRGRRQRKP